jgi:AAA+ ATPase superfamily predicted ATPase
MYMSGVNLLEFLSFTSQINESLFEQFNSLNFPVHLSKATHFSLPLLRIEEIETSEVTLLEHQEMLRLFASVELEFRNAPLVQ